MRTKTNQDKTSIKLGKSKPINTYYLRNLTKFNFHLLIKLSNLADPQEHFSRSKTFENCYDSISPNLPVGYPKIFTNKVVVFVSLEVKGALKKHFPSLPKPTSIKNAIGWNLLLSSHYQNFCISTIDFTRYLKRVFKFPSNLR